MVSPERGEFICKSVLLAGTFDLPAKCLVCNGMQYNVEHSCWTCLKRGESFKVGGSGGYAWTFPFNEENPKGPERTEQNIYDHATEALKQSQATGKIQHISGVKGPSWLHFLTSFHSVKGIAIDYMHGTLAWNTEIVVETLATYSKERYHCSHLSGVIDKRLKNIFPTLDIKRLPRSVSEHLKYWKANELRSFLLFCGVPCLYGILPSEYLEHYSLLVHAIYVTSGVNIRDRP